MSSLTILGLILLGIGSYLFGSISWAIIIGWIILKEDIRDLGDGNPGAFNAGRNLGKKFGILIMFLDVLKGLIPAIIATTVNFQEQQGWAVCVAGSSALLGHCYPIFYGFKGGNGYSAIFGFMIIFNPCMVLLWGLLVFILTLIFKYIRPVQFVSITTTGITGLFIPWSFYWRNLGYRLTPDIALVFVPILVLVVALIQTPRFTPYFFGVFKGTEEKMYLLAPIFKRRNTENQINKQLE